MRDNAHHALAEALRTYVDTTGVADDRMGWLLAPRAATTALRYLPKAAASEILTRIL
jgi:hypothetical protein